MLTYGDLAALSRRVARWALALGLEPGDRVALMMENEATYVAIWLGLSRVGVVTALFNTHLATNGVAHCVAAASPSQLIVSTSCLPALEGLDLAGIRIWQCRGATAVPGDFDDGVLACSDDLLSSDVAPPIELRAPALLIYTSGTTGLPKAAYVSHYRIMMWSEWFAGILDARVDDRLYDCLPMYHSVGGIVAVGSMLAAGGAVLVRQGFTASGFWKDVVGSRATIFQYIGELCRYLVVATDPNAGRGHALRLCCGNGLRADVWGAFADRFAIPRIIEFYAATEGSFSLFNLEGKPGAIGRIPPFMAHRSPVAIVRHDTDSEAPTRGADGFCEPCGPDEPGEAIGRLSAAEADLASRFEGYTSAADSERKVLRDVFSAGDMWFRTGDLMMRDRQGFFFFVDRIGDTFRWKGENVSTLEVADVLSACPGVVEAVVFGVPIQGVEGRAGMAALVVDDVGFDLAAFRDHLDASLPRYARPVFVRLLGAIDKTGTFRAQKTEMRRDGYDPAIVRDPLYVLDGSTYRAIDTEVCRRIGTGELRL